MENKILEDDINGLNFDSIKFAKYFYCITLILYLVNNEEINILSNKFNKLKSYLKY